MSPRSSLRIVAVLVAVCAGLWLAFVITKSESALDRAQHLSSDSGRFTTGLDAGETLAEIAGILQAEGERCDRATPRCQSTLAASAYAQVLASKVLVCTVPGRRQARESMHAYLAAVAAVEAADPVPEPGPLPVCG